MAIKQGTQDVSLRFGNTALAKVMRGSSEIQGGGGPVGPYPAPSGFRWGYVTENSQPVTENGQAVIELERIAA